MKKQRWDKKMFKTYQRFSTKGGQIVKLSNMIKFLNAPAHKEDPLAHDSA